MYFYDQQRLEISLVWSDKANRNTYQKTMKDQKKDVFLYLWAMGKHLGLKIAGEKELYIKAHVSTS